MTWELARELNPPSPEDPDRKRCLVALPGGQARLKSLLDGAAEAVQLGFTPTRAGVDYCNVQRVVQLPPSGRWPRKGVAA